MTAGERLRLLAGAGGAAGVLLLAIGSGATAGAALVDYSQLPTGTAEQHLLVDRIAVHPSTQFLYGGYSISLPRHDYAHAKKIDVTEADAEFFEFIQMFLMIKDIK